jgi:uncharacterized membrane protein YjjP (DUF1212 family)
MLAYPVPPPVTPGSADGGDDRREKVREHVSFVEDPDDRQGSAGDPSGSDDPDGGDTDAADGGASDGGDGELSDDAEELLDEFGIDPDDPEDVGSADDELDTDERVERFGNYAGVIVLPFWLLALFVGPWRLFDFSLSAGTIPFAARESASGLALLAPLPIVFLVGLAAGAIYRATTDDRPDDYRSGMAVQVVVVEVIVVAVGYLLVLAAVSGNAVLQGELLAAVIIFVAGIVGLLFFSFFEFVAIAIAVGVPAYVGVLVGDGMGLLSRKLDS